MIAREPSAAAARFREVIGRPDDEIDLAEAALLIAKSAYPDLDVGRYLAGSTGASAGAIERLSRTQMPSASGGRCIICSRSTDSLPTRELLRRRNSFLNEVLERRVGIPITLSILYIEVGRRIGLSLQGVLSRTLLVMQGQGRCGDSRPLQRWRLAERARPAAAAARGARQRCLARHRRRACWSGQEERDTGRVLRNLKAIYLEQRDRDRALSAMEWIVSIAPDDASGVRERGLLYFELECSAPRWKTWSATWSWRPKRATSTRSVITWWNCARRSRG